MIRKRFGASRSSDSLRFRAAQFCTMASSSAPEEAKGDTTEKTLIYCLSQEYDSLSGQQPLARRKITRAAGRSSPDFLRPNMSESLQKVPVSSLSSRRIVVLGNSGAGKSSAANTILGRKEFKHQMRIPSVTRGCSDAHATVSGRSVTVVDTPALFDTAMKHDELMKELARSVYLSSPGPHAFLIVFRADDRFTEQEQQIPQMIERMFGEEVLKYSIILFTHGDLLEGISIQRIIEENQALRHVVDQCGGGFHVFNNEDLNNREQVNDLLQKIDTMIEQNGGGYYSNQMFKDAHRFRRAEEERKQDEHERESPKRRTKSDSESGRCTVF